MTTAEILARLEHVKKTADGWMARCPGHPDKKPSLSISTGDDGRTLIDCKAGCPPEGVCAALGIKMADLFCDKPKRNGAGRKMVEAYDYTDAEWNLTYQVCRFEPKDFRQRRPDGKGGWIWNMVGIARVLFRLPEVLKAKDAGYPIFLCEGEKDVLAMVKRGFSATCNCGGAGKWQDDYTETLRGASVCIIADKDKAGREHAQLVAGKLHGVVKSIRVIELPDVNGSPVKDAFDFFAAGGDTGEVAGLVDAAPEFDPSKAVAAPDTKPDTAPPVALPLSALVCPAQDDASELLRRRFLCQGAWLLLCGPTGIGKSSLAVQSAILWALGRACFGIEPTRPLKSLVVQAENDAGDLSEMRDGIIRGLGITKDEAKTACDNVLICREDEFCGAAFWGRVRLLLAEHKTEILWIDPALAYIGGETNSQKDVGTFLRHGLNPLLREFNCAAVVVHHTNKPPSGTEKSKWAGGDFAYLGAGSAEWANAARAILALRSMGSHDFFELHAAKRGARLPWQDDQGNGYLLKYLAHTKEPGVIFWREADPDEVESTGRPPGKSCDPEEILDLLPPEGLETGEWVKAGKDRMRHFGNHFAPRTTGTQKGWSHYLIPERQYKRQCYTNAVMLLLFGGMLFVGVIGAWKGQDKFEKERSELEKSWERAISNADNVEELRRHPELCRDDFRQWIKKNHPDLLQANRPQEFIPPSSNPEN